jgi:hypothetical protein
MNTVTSTGLLHRPVVDTSAAPAGHATLTSGTAVRRILSEAALLLALLAAVVAVVAAKFVFFAGGSYAPDFAAPLALGATIVSVLAFFASALAVER